MVDAKVREVLGSVGQVGDTRLLLMAALLIADEHHDAGGQLDHARQELRRARSRQRAQAQPESLAADALEAAGQPDRTPGPRPAQPLDSQDIAGAGLVANALELEADGYCLARQVSDAQGP